MSTDSGYPNAQERLVLAAAESLMEETMAKYDPSHDAFHVQRVRKTALFLARANSAQNPDLLVVELAALLHDILDKKYASAEKAADPYAFFLPFFTSLSTHLDLVVDGRARQVAMVVDNVSWSTESKLREDADRLDAIGAFGIMRCAAFSAISNRPLHAPQDNPVALELSAIQHFYDKLLRIKDRLKTETGKRLGAQRHQMMVQFLQAVKHEYNLLQKTDKEIDR